MFAVAAAVLLLLGLVYGRETGAVGLMHWAVASPLCLWEGESVGSRDQRWSSNLPAVVRRYRNVNAARRWASNITRHASEWTTLLVGVADDHRVSLSAPTMEKFAEDLCTFAREQLEKAKVDSDVYIEKPEFELWHSLDTTLVQEARDVKRFIKLSTEPSRHDTAQKLMQMIQDQHRHFLLLHRSSFRFVLDLLLARDVQSYEATVLKLVFQNPQITVEAAMFLSSPVLYITPPGSIDCHEHDVRDRVDVVNLGSEWKNPYKLEAISNELAAHLPQGFRPKSDITAARDKLDQIALVSSLQWVSSIQLGGVDTAELRAMDPEQKQTVIYLQSQVLRRLSGNLYQHCSASSNQMGLRAFYRLSLVSIDMLGSKVGPVLRSIFDASEVSQDKLKFFLHHFDRDAKLQQRAAAIYEETQDDDVLRVLCSIWPSYEPAVCAKHLFDSGLLSELASAKSIDPIFQCYYGIAIAKTRYIGYSYGTQLAYEAARTNDEALELVLSPLDLREHQVEDFKTLIRSSDWDYPFLLPFWVNLSAFLNPASCWRTRESALYSLLYIFMDLHMLWSTLYHFFLHILLFFVSMIAICVINGASPQRAPVTHDEDYDHERHCAICMDRNQEVMLIPCGHNVFCIECSNRLHWEGARCPICRVDIQHFEAKRLLEL